jgi:hypothetical protein
MKPQNLLLLGIGAFLIYKLINKSKEGAKKTVTPSPDASLPIVKAASQVVTSSPDASLPFVKAAPQVIDFPQVNPTPATVLNPKQLEYYNTGIVYLPSMGETYQSCKMNGTNLPAIC